MAKTIAVTLAEGCVANIPRISTFTAPEGMAEKIRFIEDQIYGTSVTQMQRKAEREELRIKRLEKMVERCEAFIDHESTTFEKREEYLKKIETYENDIEKCQERLESYFDQIITLDRNLRNYSIEIAEWILHESGMDENAIKNNLTDILAIDVVRAGFGFEPSEKVDENTPSPLTHTEEKSNGTDGSPSVQET